MIQWSPLAVRCRPDGVRVAKIRVSSCTDSGRRRADEWFGVFTQAVTKNMPVRKATKEEARALFGGGLVMFGPRRQPPSPSSPEAGADPMQPAIDAIEAWLNRPLESAPASAAGPPRPSLPTTKLV